MKIEIWSDIMCPFCYIGKKHFEEAFEIVTSEKHPNVSIRFHIISNIIDTALHESHHLWAAHKHKNYEDPNIEQEESNAELNQVLIY